MATLPATRGYGLLEGFLAGQRYRLADALIPPRCREGRLLDIGCGKFGVFLRRTHFAEKYGIDPEVEKDEVVDHPSSRIRLVRHKTDHGNPLPFDDQFFETVTMLAVFEHILPDCLPMLLDDIHRVLKPGGVFVMTTPAARSEGFLWALAACRLVSRTEMADHKALYTARDIRRLLQDSGFPAAHIHQGSIQFGMNLWAVAHRDHETVESPRQHFV